MAALVLLLLSMLLVILLAAELFTNALEHIGAALEISEGVTGSLFAAVGTALPETVVPLLAIFFGGPSASVNEEIGVGAILGAPLMLSTLSSSLFCFGLLLRGGRLERLRPEPTGLRRDLDCFLAAFALAALALWVPPESFLLRRGLSVVLVGLYILYVVRTFNASEALVAAGHKTEAEQTLHATRLGLPSRSFSAVLQLIVATVLLIAGAKGFITGVTGVAPRLGISALLLSLLIVPVATELPEKVNSVLWVRRGRDTLALGNITGAMVFQGTVLPAVGILLTPWNPRIEVLCGVLITLFAALWLRLQVRRQGIPAWTFAVNGLLYLVYLAVTLALARR